MSDDTSEDMVVPQLPYIIKFCKAHGVSKENVTKIGDEDIQLGGKSNDELKEMLLVANYLNIKEMLDYLTKTLANRIKNKSVEYIRKFFGIQTNFMPEEEEAARKDNYRLDID
ncbi:hypothetical protein CUMW_267440 [Citrus unshiu]|uniref:SKP1 component dimerisation domain-containing protein n=1 Tax=Citrus unshiu TaxID=55188 RepID=A0A2H5QW88_CITUN|nr:hypothetical protein CUMW_267440 [Citrus unshiu]